MSHFADAAKEIGVWVASSAIGFGFADVIVSHRPIDPVADITRAGIAAVILYSGKSIVNALRHG